jgi:hypothetical protein
MTEWDDTKSILGRRLASVLLAGEALYVLFALIQIAADEDPETGESLAPVAAALSIIVIPLLIAFGATAWMLWGGRIWPASVGRSRAARNFVAVGVVVLINGALALQMLVGAMTLQLETSRAIAGFAGLIVATACGLMVRESWRERF